MRCVACGLANFDGMRACRRCGGQLVDTRPPPPPMARTAGDDVVTVAKEAHWPARCVKCGTPGGLEWRDERYTWYPRWTYLLLVFGLLPAAIAQVALAQRAGLTHAVCAPCNARWSQGRATYVAAFCVPLVGALALVVAGAATNAPALILVAALLLVPGIVVLPVLAYWLAVRPRVLRAVFIDDRVVTLAGLAPTVLAEMNERRA
jgi:hypothetical protein